MTEVLLALSGHMTSTFVCARLGAMYSLKVAGLRSQAAVGKPKGGHVVLQGQRISAWRHQGVTTKEISMANSRKE